MLREKPAQNLATDPMAATIKSATFLITPRQSFPPMTEALALHSAVNILHNVYQNKFIAFSNI